MAQADEAACAVLEARALDRYVEEKGVTSAVNDLVQMLCEARPRNPRQWLLRRLEKELDEDDGEDMIPDIHRLFAASQVISREVVPRNTIHAAIRESISLLHCDTVSVFVLDKKSDMLTIFASNQSTPIKVRPGQGIAGSIFNTGEHVNIADCYEDSRFDRSFDRKTGYITKTLLAVPIKDFEDQPVGVLQAINKLPVGVEPGPYVDDKGETVPAGTRAIPFPANDAKILHHLCQHVGIALRNAEVYREAIRTGERVTGLLETIGSLSQDLGAQSLMLTITNHANKIVSAQRSTVFLLDAPKKQLWSVATDTGAEIRIPMEAGIAGLCCTEGRYINIPDAYADARFNQEVDKKTGFRTHSILAIPLYEEHQSAQHLQPAKRASFCAADMAKTRSKTRLSVGEGPVQKRLSAVHFKSETPFVLGVLQVINKQSYDGLPEAFDQSDIEVLEVFAACVTPKLTASSTLMRRPSSCMDVTEGELALSSNHGILENETTEDRYRKRKSRTATEGVFSETEEYSIDLEGLAD